MAYRPKNLMDLVDLVTRWYAGYSISGLGHALGIDRKTARRYIRSVEALGLSREGPLPPAEVLRAMLSPMVPVIDRTAPVREGFDLYRGEIIDLVTRKTDPLLPKTAYEVIVERHGVVASYSTFKRFIRRALPQTPPSTCRIEVEPGQEIQVDYGKMGLLPDETGRMRTVYAFCGTLSHSRLKFIEFVFSQNQESFAASHVRMFAHFQGVSRTLIIDNLKSGVLKPDLYDPELNPLYRDLATHHGYFVDTARVARATDKGKVERCVPLARQLFRKMKELHPSLTLGELNRLALSWCRIDNGLAVHGTTGEKPAEVWAARERAALKPLPGEPFELATWKPVTVHPDQYIQFDKKSYSLPEAFIGRTLWARGTERYVRVYDEQFVFVRQYVRTDKTYRTTVWSDFPADVQLMLDDRHVAFTIRKAKAIGPAMGAYVTWILEPHAKLNLRKAMALVGLAGKHDADVLDRAAEQALAARLKYREFRQLVEAPPIEADVPIPISPETAALLRPADYFIQPEPDLWTTISSSSNVN